MTRMFCDLCDHEVTPANCGSLHIKKAGGGTVEVSHMCPSCFQQINRTLETCND